MKLPTGFVPNEDQGYFFSVFTLPDGASMERTDQLMKRAEADLKSIPGVEEVLTTGGLNLLTNAYTSNNASIIAMLKPWEERKSKEEQLEAILAGRPEEVRRLSGGGLAGVPAASHQRSRQRLGIRLRTAGQGRPDAAGAGGGEREVHAGDGQAAGTDRHLFRLQHLHSPNQAGHRPRQGPHLEHSRQ